MKSPNLRLLAILACLTGAAVANADPRPNFLFIFADDFGIDSLSCYGGDRFATPEMDALADPGIRFEWFYSEAVCSSARAQLLTGQYSFLNGTIGNLVTNFPDGYNSPSLAKPLVAAGYATAFIGKDHGTGGDLRADWGFDYHSSLGGGRYWGSGSPYYNGSSYSYTINGTSYSDTEADDFLPDLQCRLAEDWITANKAGPFLLYLPLYLPHAAASSPWVYTPTPLTETAHLGLDQATRKNTRAERYKDMIEYTDLIVGKLVQHLKDEGLYDNTIIFLSGDNGTLGRGSVDGRLLDAGKASFLNGGCHVPLLVHWPARITTAIVSDEIVDTCDILPTMVDLAEGELPAGFELHGQSLAPLFLGEPFEGQGYAFAQIDYDYLEGDKWYVRGPDFRLNADGGLWDMSEAPFDHEVVPAETTDPAAIEARRRLQAILDRLDPRSGPNYEWQKDRYSRDGYQQVHGIENPYFEFKNRPWPGNRQLDSVSGDFADPDGDGVINLFEHDLGTDPTVADAAPFRLEAGLENGRLVARHTTLTSDAARIDVEVSDGLGGWDDGSPHTMTASAGGDTVVSDGESTTTAPSRFMRYRIGRSRFNEPGE